jgi:polar amino acid transport system substrate-binding protein
MQTNEKNKKKVEKVSGVDTSLRLLKMLNDKRIQVIVDDKSVMSFTLKNAPSPELKDVKTAGCLKPAPLFVAFSPHVKKEADAMLKVFDEGLLKLRKSGELKKIFESYGLSFSGFRNK